MNTSEGNPEEEPPKLTVHDVVFRKGGPYPPAALGYRLLAFCIDAALMGAISFFILTRIILPTWFPLEQERFQDWAEEYAEEKQDNPEAKPFSMPSLENLPRDVWKMLIMAQNAVFMLFWLYFAVADTFFQGQTLGKRTFRLKIVHMATLSAPDLPSAFIRSSIKTICLFTLFPFALINFVLVFFLKYKRAGHDYVGKTIVIEDNTVPSPDNDSAVRS